MVYFLGILRILSGAYICTAAYYIYKLYHHSGLIHKYFSQHKKGDIFHLRFLKNILKKNNKHTYHGVPRNEPMLTEV